MPDILCTGLIISRDQRLAVRLPDKARLVAMPSAHRGADCGICAANGLPDGAGCRIAEHVPFRACDGARRVDGRHIHWVKTPR
jgi:hypothetical protein